jgi:hypothetical protein
MQASGPLISLAFFAHPRMVCGRQMRPCVRGGNPYIPPLLYRLRPHRVWGVNPWAKRGPPDAGPSSSKAMGALGDAAARQRGLHALL